MKRITNYIILLVIAFRCHSSPTECQNDEWQCMDGACISRGGRCDNFPDCLDNSDEENCAGPVCLEGLEACPQPNGKIVCVKKAVGCNCGPVKIIANGKIDSDSITIGSVATVTCDAGYDATLPTVTCDVTGLWEDVSCIPKDCGAPEKIAFGKVTLSDINNTKYGANADVVCDVGFETLTPVIRCVDKGSWETAVCTAKDCGPVTKIVFGKVILSDLDNTTYGANADVVCDVGFETVTPVIKCDETGSWETAVCKAKDCGPVAKIVSGKIVLNDIKNTTYGANAEIVCDVGFETLTPVIKCDEKGSWETAVCLAIDCGPVAKIVSGKIILSDIDNTTYGANADVVCNVGFETLTPVVKCDEKGSWETAVCTAKDCGTPEKIPFGKIILSDINNTTFGANADIVCDVGFETLTPVIKCDEKGSWETAVCTAKDCRAPGKIAFGNVILSDINNTTYGANADVVCDVGYKTLTPVIKCDENGSWETAVCTPIDCGVPGKIAFGNAILSDINNTTYGANADVVCDVGYKTLTPVIKCDENGSWETAVCTPIDCGVPGKIAFGNVILSDINNTTYGANADVVCDVGYKTLTPVIKCDENGSWETAVCTAIDCGVPGKIAFGNVILNDINNTTYGANADVVCDVGFATITPVITCDEKGSWTTTVCTVKDCGAPGKIAFGNVILRDINNTTYGASANVVCDVGFETFTPVIKCDEKGSWETAVCKAKDCGIPGKIAFGNVILSGINNTKYGASADVVCDVGFETITPVIKCDDKGSWETTVCTAKDCGQPEKIAFGYVILSDINNTTYGANADVVCDVGFETITPVITCDEKGSWETTVCTAKDCGIPGKTAFGNVILSDINNTTYGASADVVCDVGFATITPVIKCDEKGSWSTTVCTAKDCGVPRQIAFGNVIISDINNTTYGSSADVVCDVGFETITPVIKCDETGSWETAACIAKDCGPTPSVSFGKITLFDDKNSTYGATATVTCDSGYMENKQYIVCQSSGVWEDVACLPRDCGPVQSIAFGTIILADSNNTTIGASAIVICNLGFESNTTEILCLKSGLWERAVCTIRRCGYVPEISHGTIKALANDSVGSFASVVCDKGYKANVSSVFCQISGQWESASCSIKDCGFTPMIPFGQITPNNRNITTYGATANVTCYTGYTANVSQVLCQSSGLWEESACKPIDCGPPPSIRHGSTFLGIDNKTTYGATAFVFCKDKYVATMSVIKCQSSGIWENATCVLKDCGQPPVIINGQSRLTDYRNTSYGASASVTCFRGYESNVSRILCQSTGVWQAAVCRPKNCGPPPFIKNGHISLIGRLNTTVGAIAVVSCNDFYVATRRFIKCLSSGQWMNATCISRGDERCGPVPKILHGRITATGNHSVGSRAFVTCDVGYTANVSSVMCKSSRQWEQAYCSASNFTSMQCYKCRRECSNAVCNQETEVCPRSKQACQTIVLWKHGYYTLKKGCKRPSANTTNARSKCRRFGFKIVCRYECNGNLCNRGIPSINFYG